MSDIEDQGSKTYLARFVREIGMMVVTASQFDYRLANLLCECFALSAFQENALLRPLGTRAKLDTLQRLAKFTFDKDPKTKRVIKWCERAKALLNDRNTVIHGSPGIRDGKITLRLYSGGNAFEGGGEEWPLERVTNLT